MLGGLGPEALTTNLINRNISSTCNSSGSAIWASVKNIKPLVDANCHTEAIEIACRQSPIFPPVHYRNPGSKSHAPSGQIILFGCPLELRTVGELTKVPPVLEYLLDSVRDWPRRYFRSLAVGQQYGNCTTYSLHSKMEEYWPLVNELEQAWTGVEESDRAIISDLVSQHNYNALIVVCLLRYAIWKAKRRCRDTSWSFQSQYCQMVELAWLRRKNTTTQACIGFRILPVKAAPYWLFSKPWLLFRLGLVVIVFLTWI